MFVRNRFGLIVPFLVELGFSTFAIEFSFSLPEEDRLPNGVLKGILKKAYEEEIGRSILYRNKMGFSMPYNFFRERESLQEQLLEDFWLEEKWG